MLYEQCYFYISKQLKSPAALLRTSRNCRRTAVILIYICFNYIHRKLIKDDCVKMFMVLITDVCKKRTFMLHTDYKAAYKVRENGLRQGHTRMISSVGSQTCQPKKLRWKGFHSRMKLLSYVCPSSRVTVNLIFTWRGGQHSLHLKQCGTY